MRDILQVTLIIALVLGLTQGVSAQKNKKAAVDGPKQEKIRNIISSTSHELQGEVSWINKKHIAIIYNRDTEKGTEEEILLPLDGSIQLQHKRSLDEIAVGDVVSIQYAEETEEDEHKERKESRKATVITFVKPGVKKPSPAVSQDDVDDGVLPLKGIIGE